MSDAGRKEPAMAESTITLERTILGELERIAAAADVTDALDTSLSEPSVGNPVLEALIPRIAKNIRRVDRALEDFQALRQRLVDAEQFNVDGALTQKIDELRAMIQVEEEHYRATRVQLMGLMRRTQNRHGSGLRNGSAANGKWIVMSPPECGDTVR
jgi:hypothetical protein